MSKHFVKGILLCLVLVASNWLSAASCSCRKSTDQGTVVITYTTSGTDCSSDITPGSGKSYLISGGKVTTLEGADPNACLETQL